MPKQQTKAQIAHPIQPIMDALHLQVQPAETDKDSLQRQLSNCTDWRQRQTDLGHTEPLSHYKPWAGKLLRVACYYLDSSGTEKAAKKNEALYQSISTEEGMRAFANRVARDILRADLRNSFFSGTPEEAAKQYFENPLEYELGWVCKDLILDCADILDPTVTAALEDRKEVLQGLGVFSAGVEIIGDKYYSVVSDITQETLDLNDRIEEQGFFDRPEIENNADIKAFSKYLLSISNYQKMITGVQLKQNEAGLAFLDKFNVTPYTVFTDDSGNRIDCMTAILRYSQQQVVHASTLPTKEELKQAGKEGPSRDALEYLVTLTDAERPIQKPTAENPALFNQFGANALKAQGKGLTEEYRRLASVMDDSTYLFAIASDEFKGIRKELHRLGDGDTVPNRDECQASMEKILEFADKYIRDKTGLTLKPREQKRLDAVIAVRDSLTPRFDTLKAIKEGAEKQHTESYRATGENAVGVQSSLENQTNVHVNTVEQKLAVCYEEALLHANEQTAVGDLATSVSETLNGMRAYAVNPACDPEKTGLPYQESFDTKLAQLAVFGVLLRERRNTAGDGICPMGEKLNQMRNDPQKWNAMIHTVSQAEAVKKAMQDIRENPQQFSDYIGKNGFGKLTDDVIAEAAPNAVHKGQNPHVKQNDAPARQPNVK